MAKALRLAEGETLAKSIQSQSQSLSHLQMVIFVLHFQVNIFCHFKFCNNRRNHFCPQLCWLALLLWQNVHIPLVIIIYHCYTTLNWRPLLCGEWQQAGGKVTRKVFSLVFLVSGVSYEASYEASFESVVSD